MTKYAPQIVEKEGRRYLIIDATDTGTVIELAVRLNLRTSSILELDDWLDHMPVPDNEHALWSVLRRELVQRGVLDDE